MGTVFKKDNIRNKELLDYKVHIRTTKIMPVLANNTAQKMKFFIQDFFSEYDQIRRKLRIWSHSLKKS